MTKVVEAIYAQGVLKPVETLELAEQQRVRLTLEPIEASTSDERRAAFRRFQMSVEQGSFFLTGKLPTRDELHER